MYKSAECVKNVPSIVHLRREEATISHITDIRVLYSVIFNLPYILMDHQNHHNLHGKNQGVSYLARASKIKAS